MRFGSERDDRLGSRPAVGAQPDALYTRYLRAVDDPPGHQKLNRQAQAEFAEWARGQDDVATVADLAVIAAAEDAMFPPSPAFRVKWRSVLAWSPILALAGLGAVTAARYIVHHPLAFWAVAFTAVYFACQVTPDGRP